jgi:hypothetical protein
VADERAQQVARLAAGLLPEAPPAHDAFGYLSWEELVLSTARRLQWLLDDATLLAPPRVCRPRPGVSGRLDGDALLTLAVLLVHDDSDAACAELLSEAVAG